MGRKESRNLEILDYGQEIVQKPRNARLLAGKSLVMKDFDGHSVQTFCDLYSPSF